MIATADKTPTTKAQWQKLLRLAPGYDPLRGMGATWFNERGARRAGRPWFCPEKAQQAIDFFPEMLRHVEGALAGTPFVLEEWQKCVIANLFGWVRVDNKGRLVRRFRKCLLYVPRKNGKTPLAAGICLFVLFCDGERGAQIYSAAADREQAALLYRHAAGMVNQEPILKNASKVFGGSGHRSIVLQNDQASSYKVISADANTKHGYNSHLCLVDELHAQPDRELCEVLETSMASANRAQPLMIYLTTADFERESICNEVHDYACRVRDAEIEDIGFLPIIYEATRDDDWTSPVVWERANPNLGVSVSEEYMHSECAKAREVPAYENTFKRLHLNIRTEQDVRLIPMELWDDRCSGELDESTLEGQRCFTGLDLASTIDIAAAAHVFPMEEEGDHHVVWRFWVPRENVQRMEKRDKVPYQSWIDQGWITPTPGDVIDYDKIRADLNTDWEHFNIQKVGIDRWNATQLAVQLQGDGFEVEMYGQGYASMSAPTKEVLRLLTDGRLKHGDNPVARWMASNTAGEEDGAGNLKPSKKKSTQKIDGIVALVMGEGLAMQDEGGGVGIFVI